MILSKTTAATIEALVAENAKLRKVIEAAEDMRRVLAKLSEEHGTVIAAVPRQRFDKAKKEAGYGTD